MTEGRIPTEARPPGIGKLARLPVFLALEGKRAVVAGGSAAAAWKAELIAAAGANVDVYAEDISEEMTQIAAGPPNGAVLLHQRAWTADDLAGAALAIGAFDEDIAAAAFAAAARTLRIPVNVIDKPAHCDFTFGAVVNRSPLVIGISTDGAAPVFAQAIRAKLEALLPKGFALWADAARRWRAAMQGAGFSFAGRRRFWQLFTAQAMTNPEQAPTNDDFVSFYNQVRGLGVTVDKGSVTLVGAGPGDPELLTLRAVRALQSADVILFDDLVSSDVLEFARREAKKLMVGKTGHGPSCKQEDINALMVGLAKQGKRVVRLKGGDPLIFARGAEEISACKAAGIAVDVIPGITAAQGAASRLGLALTGRAQARRLQFVTGHSRDGRVPEDIDWRALADPVTTTAIYMPAKTLSTFISKAIEQGLDPHTPAIAVARATRPDQAVVAETACQLPARLAEANLPGPLLVILGGAVAAADARKLSVDEDEAFGPTVASQ